MIHPNLGDLSEFTLNELEQKVLKLNSMYFMTQDENVRHQMILLIDSYKIEIEERRRQQKKEQEDTNSDLDNLINVS